MIIQYEHEINTGHRLFGHKGKCKNLHGHNYKITFELEGPLNPLGMVLDFAVVKGTFGKWLDEHWDHKVMLFEKDPLFVALQVWNCGAISVPFNPTAENMARHLFTQVVPNYLKNFKDVTVRAITVEETPTSKATAISAV